MHSRSPSDLGGGGRGEKQHIITIVVHCRCSLVPYVGWAPEEINWNVVLGSSQGST